MGPELPVKVEIGAKATLDIKAEIPTVSAGRFVDALTDIIRPWAEKRGLKADLIRLQREDVALEIARRAARRIEIENPEPRPIPLKVLVPLLEKGSQEDSQDDFMIDMWANLLAASASDTSVPPRFVGIMSELDGRQARLLHYIAVEKEGFDPFRGAWAVQEHAMINAITRALRKRPTSKKLGDEIFELFRASGTFLDTLHVGQLQSIDWMEDPPGGWKERDIEVLASLGLVKSVAIHREGANKQINPFTLVYYHITTLADEFLRAAGALREGRNEKDK